MHTRAHGRSACPTCAAVPGWRHRGLALLLLASLFGVRATLVRLVAMFGVCVCACPHPHLYIHTFHACTDRVSGARGRCGRRAGRRRAAQGLGLQRDRRDGACGALRAHQPRCPVRPPRARLLGLRRHARGGCARQPVARGVCGGGAGRRSGDADALAATVECRLPLVLLMIVISLLSCLFY